MFAIGTNIWFVHTDRGGDLQARPLVRKALWADYVLNIIFGVLATLGFAGVLPMAVGITFCVLMCIQLALVGLVNAQQKCLAEKEKKQAHKPFMVY